MSVNVCHRFDVQRTVAGAPHPARILVPGGACEIASYPLTSEDILCAQSPPLRTKVQACHQKTEIARVRAAGPARSQHTSHQTGDADYDRASNDGNQQMAPPPAIHARRSRSVK